MKVLITGASGQLGYELAKSAPSHFDLILTAREKLDISDTIAVDKFFKQYEPEVVINAAAYTAVDLAETETELAAAINHKGPENLAISCSDIGSRLIHVSTDYVFGGDKVGMYCPDDLCQPLNNYGQTKFDGEQSVQKHLSDNYVIVRTAWVYSVHGNNFVKTMLRLMSEKESLNIVGDQIGAPTWANGLAHWIWATVDKPDITGLFHWTDAGVASWYDFAIAIQEIALEKGLLKKSIPIAPIASSEFPTPAKRPAFSLMDSSISEKTADMPRKHWRIQLNSMLEQLAKP